MRLSYSVVPRHNQEEDCSGLDEAKKIVDRLGSKYAVLRNSKYKEVASFKEGEWTVSPYYDPEVDNV